jgi:hypothetical protein
MGLTNFPDGVDVKTLYLDGVSVTAVEAHGIIGVADGYALARGITALDGSNPTPIATGLTTVTGFACTLEGSSAPGDGTSVLTYAISGGTVNVYAWKNTGGTDPTLVASTGTENVGWIAIGTKA